MCLWFCLASLRARWPLPFWYTIIKQMFYERKAPHSELLKLKSICGLWGNQTHNSQTTKLTYGNHVCVSVCVPWGPLCVCWVRGGRSFNKETGLVQGCQSDRPGTFNLMGSRWEPPDWTSSSKIKKKKKLQLERRLRSIAFSLRAHLWVYAGIWGVNSHIKAPFSFKAFRRSLENVFVHVPRAIACKRILGAKWTPRFSVGHQM